LPLRGKKKYCAAKGQAANAGILLCGLPRGLTRAGGPLSFVLMGTWCRNIPGNRIRFIVPSQLCRRPRPRRLSRAVSLPLFSERNVDERRIRPYSMNMEKKGKCGLVRIWGSREASQICYQAICPAASRARIGRDSCIRRRALHGHAGMDCQARSSISDAGEDLAGRAASGTSPIDHRLSK